MAKHKLPFNQVTILGIQYKIELVQAPLYDDDGVSECWGTTDNDNYVIKIVDGHKKRVNRVLCHEIVHVWQDAQGRQMNEEEAVRFEIALFDLFTNQPDLVDFLKQTRW